MFTIWSVYMFALGQLLIAMCGAEVYRHIHYKDVETVVEDALLRQLQQIDGQPLPFRPHIDSFDVSADTPDGAEQVRESEWAAGTYYSAFTVQLGFSMMLPFALELIVERGTSTAVRTARSSCLRSSRRWSARSPGVFGDDTLTTR